MRKLVCILFLSLSLPTWAQTSIVVNGSFEDRSTRVEFVIVADEIGSHANERARLAEPLDPSSTLVEDTITGADSTDIVHNGLQRRRP